MSIGARKPGRPRSDRPKTIQFSIRLSAQNLEKVEEIASILGTSINHAVTLCIETMEISEEVAHAAQVLAAARISLVQGTKNSFESGSSIPESNA